jgi:hypothetical protein
VGFILEELVERMTTDILYGAKLLKERDDLILNQEISKEGVKVLYGILTEASSLGLKFRHGMR